MTENFDIIPYGKRISRLINLMTLIEEKACQPNSKEELLKQFSFYLEFPPELAWETFQLLKRDGLWDACFIDDDCEKFKHLHLTEEGKSYRESLILSIMPKQVADQRLDEFLKKVRNVNASDSFVFSVSSVKVWGSYLTDEDVIFGIYLYVTLQSKVKGVDLPDDVILNFYSSLEQDKPIEKFYHKIFALRGEVIQYLDMQSQGIQFVTNGEKGFRSDIVCKEISNFHNAN